MWHTIQEMILNLPGQFNAIALAYEGIGDIQQALNYFEKGKSLLVNANKANYELLISAKGLVADIRIKRKLQKRIRKRYDSPKH